MKKFAFPALLLAIAAVLVGLFFLGGGGKPVAQKPESQLLGTKHETEGDKHVADGTKVAYKTNMPSSGDHYGTPIPWGIKDAEIQDEVWVHNLEHGGVVIAYKPDLDPAMVQKLKDLFNQLPKSQNFNSIKAVLVPRAKNTQAIQLAAWNYTLELQGFDEPQIRQFYIDHLDKGPELVP